MGLGESYRFVRDTVRFLPDIFLYGLGSLTLLMERAGPAAERNNSIIERLTVEQPKINARLRNSLFGRSYFSVRRRFTS